MNSSPLLTQEEAARFLALSPKTLARWRWAGRGPEFVKLGSSVRYQPEALHEFISTDEAQS